MSTAIDIYALPGLTEDELRRLGPCPICGKRIAETGELTFYRVRIEHCALDLKAIRRRIGLGMAVGNPYLADALSPDRHLAKIVGDAKTVLIHESCALEAGVILRAFEDGNDAEKAQRS